MASGRSAEEAADADKTDRAHQALREHDYQTAIRLLNEVVANTPPQYTYSYEEEGKLNVKFWSEEEWMGFLEFEFSRGQVKRDIVWHKSAYPRAHYWLGYIEVEHKNFDKALQHLAACLRLEPDNPMALCEAAMVHQHAGRLDKALQLYESALSSRPCVASSHRARALRGRGVILIDKGRLAEAKASLEESLQYDPNSESARGELRYIEHLRQGGAAAAVEFIATGKGQPRPLAGAAPAAPRPGGAAPPSKSPPAGLRGLFTDPEWQTLVFAPLVTFLSVAASDGKVDEKEMAAFKNALARSALAGDALTSEVARHTMAAPNLMAALRADGRPVFEVLSAVRQLVDARLPPAAAVAFKKSLLALGLETAKASGSFFGSKVSKKESEALAALAAILKIEADGP